MSATTEPVIRRKFQLTNLSGNNNKWWMVEYWNDGTLKTTWGRVGAGAQSKTKVGMQRWDAEDLCREKINKGYQEIDLHRPTAGPVATGVADPTVQSFVEYILKESGQYISTYLAGSIDALSVAQLKKGRDYLMKIQLAGYTGGRIPQPLVNDVEQYLNTIPTKLPARIDIHDVVVDFLKDLHEQEDRLLQLEAALATYQASNGQKVNANTALGDVKITTLAQTSAAYASIADYIARTSGGRRKIHNIFSIEIPKERVAFENETFGKSGVATLFHGTRNPNVPHILRSGLIIPGTAANGSRFGRGIYFANMSRRSLNYCGGKGNLNVLFLNDVALGNPKRLKGDDSSLRAAPNGYHSVWGQESYSGMDEFIVYRPSQQTIRALVTIE